MVYSKNSGSSANRKPAGRVSASKPVARSTGKPVAGKPVAKKPSFTAQPAKAVSGSKAGFTAQMRAAGQRVGDIVKEDKTFKNAETEVELAKALRIAVGGKTVHLLDVPWEERNYPLALGAQRHNSMNFFYYVGDLLPERLKKYENEPYSYTRWLEDEMNGRIKPIPKNPSVMKPRPHQIEAINKIVNYKIKGFRGFIEADATGVGKTISCLYGISEIAKIKGFTKQKPAKLLIMCPKSVIPHWRNTLKSINTPHLRVLIINYDQSKKLLTEPASATEAAKTSTKNRHTAAKGKPQIRFDYIIADEAHKMKNIYTSQRSQAFSNIARYAEPAEKAPFIIWATATVGQTPIEVGYLAPLIGQVSKKNLTLKNWGEYLVSENYEVKKSKKGNDYNWIKAFPNASQQEIERIRVKQRADIVKMSSMLFGEKLPSIRRIPDDIAGWPSIQRIPLPSQLTDVNKALYDQLWTEFRSFLQLNPHGKDPQGGLAQQLRFRQKSSLLKTLDTIEAVTDYVENNIQVAVSVQFIESLTGIKNGLEKKGIRVAEFSGRLGSYERELERLRFQKGKAEVVLFTVTEGISLHAGEQLPDGSTATDVPRITYVHDVRYSGLEMSQIEGRAHRDSQKANIYYSYAEDTIEEAITKNMIQRLANMSSLSGDDDSIIDLIENLIRSGKQ